MRDWLPRHSCEFPNFFSFDISLELYILAIRCSEFVSANIASSSELSCMEYCLAKYFVMGQWSARNCSSKSNKWIVLNKGLFLWELHSLGSAFWGFLRLCFYTWSTYELGIFYWSFASLITWCHNYCWFRPCCSSIILRLKGYYCYNSN